MSPLPTPCTCPLRIMFITSYPCSVRPAVSKEKKPIPGLTSRLMKRWSCSTRLFKYLTCLSSTDAGRIPAALSSAMAFGYAAFLSTLITRGADGGGLGSAGAVGSFTGEAAFVSTVLTRGADLVVVRSARAVGSSTGCVAKTLRGTHGQEGSPFL